MASRDLAEDIAFLLYLAPIVASIVYGVYEWYATAHASSTMPGSAFLIVSKSPYLYLFSIVAVCVGLIIEVRGTAMPERPAVVVANATRLQILSVVVLVVTFAASLNVASYDFGNAFSVFIAGRYAIIFAFSCVLLSLLLAPKQIIGTARLSSLPEIIGLILFAASPLVLYGTIKVLHLGFAIGAIAAIIAAIIGAYLFFSNTNIFKRKSPTSQITPQQQSAAAPQAKA